MTLTANTRICNKCHKTFDNVLSECQYCGSTDFKEDYE